MKDFLADKSAIQFAWYLGMDGAKRKIALDTTDAPGWFGTVLEKLEEVEMVKKDGALVKALPRNFAIGWKSE